MPADQIADLTPAERTQLAQTLADLHACGYVDVDQHEQIRPGARIRHSGHRWPEAFERGTGVVVALTERPDSPWSASWGKPDVELVALWDQPPWSGASRLSQLAQYHVAVIEGGEPRG